jgi:hypothetical protein
MESLIVQVFGPILLVVIILVALSNMAGIKPDVVLKPFFGLITTILKAFVDLLTGIVRLLASLITHQQLPPPPRLATRQQEQDPPRKHPKIRIVVQEDDEK